MEGQHGILGVGTLTYLPPKRAASGIDAVPAMADCRAWFDNF
jgi:hypothetical protein